VLGLITCDVPFSEIITTTMAYTTQRVVVARSQAIANARLAFYIYLPITLLSGILAHPRE
jgi:hypothetical protein